MTVERAVPAPHPDGAQRMGECGVHVFVQHDAQAVGRPVGTEPRPEHDRPSVGRGDLPLRAVGVVDVPHEQGGRGDHGLRGEDLPHVLTQTAVDPAGPSLHCLHCSASFVIRHVAFLPHALVR